MAGEVPTSCQKYPLFVAAHMAENRPEVRLKISGSFMLTNVSWEAIRLQRLSVQFQFLSVDETERTTD